LLFATACSGTSGPPDSPSVRVDSIRVVPATGLPGSNATVTAYLTAENCAPEATFSYDGATQGGTGTHPSASFTRGTNTKNGSVAVTCDTRNANGNYAITVTQPPAPPTAQSPTLTRDEASTLNVNLGSLTTGASHRTYLVQAPPTLDATLDGSQLTVKARDDGITAWDDVSGTFQLPYSVSDANGTANGVITLTLTPQPDVTYTLSEVAGANAALTNLTFRANGQDFTAIPLGGKVQLRTGANTLELKANPGWRNLQVWRINGKTIPLNQNDATYTETLGSDDITAALQALSATVHDWYRDDADPALDSEQHVRIVYWDGNNVNQGFSGTEGITILYTPRNPVVVDGIVICSTTSDAHAAVYGQGVAVENQSLVAKGLPAAFEHQIVDDLPAGIVSFENEAMVLAESRGILCDRPDAGANNSVFSRTDGHFKSFIAMVEITHHDGFRLAELRNLGLEYRETQDFGGGSLWVRQADGNASSVELPGDIGVKTYFRRLANAARALGLKAPKF